MLSQLYIAITLPYIFSFSVYNLNVTTCEYFIFYKIIYVYTCNAKLYTISTKQYAIQPCDVVTCIKKSPFSCPVIETFVWIGPVLRGRLSYKDTVCVPTVTQHCLVCWWYDFRFPFWSIILFCIINMYNLHWRKKS
jgi:hypothetical protein